MGCQERQGRQERQNDAAFCQKYSVHFFGFLDVGAFYILLLAIGAIFGHLFVSVALFQGFTHGCT